MIRDIPNGEIHPDIAKLPRSSRLVGVPKHPTGIRPIPVGETIVRVAGSIAFKNVLPKALE